MARKGGLGTCGVGSGLLGGVKGAGTEGAMGGISTAAGGAALGMPGVLLLLLMVVVGAAVCTLMPLLLLCVAVVGGGVRHGRANCWYGCGAEVGVSLAMLATGEAAAAAAVGMQMGGGSSTIKAAARAAPADAMPLLQLVLLGSGVAAVLFAALNGATETRLDTDSLPTRATACAVRQPGAAWPLLLLCSCAMVECFMAYAFVFGP